MKLPKPQTPAEELFAFTEAMGALMFGTYKTKAGRMSPYFFDAGRFSDGKSLWTLGKLYAKTILNSSLQFDGLFGPAYKGIPLVCATAIALSELGENYPYTYDRKEEKDHGERGALIGAPLKRRILVTDDVISAGTSVRRSAKLIKNAGAELAGVVVSLDRQEKGQGELSAIQEVQQMYGVPVIAIARLEDMVRYLERARDMGLDSSAAEIVDNINAYREQYGTIAA